MKKAMVWRYSGRVVLQRKLAFFPRNLALIRLTVSEKMGFTDVRRTDGRTDGDSSPAVQ